MILWQLFLAFLEVGVTAFGGGYAALPIIQNVIVERNQWLTMTEMTDILSLSQVTPGPIAINSATFVGIRLAGIPGVIVASIATVLPQAILLFILSAFIFSGRKLTLVDRALGGLRPGVVGLIAAASVSITISAIFAGTSVLGLDFIALAGFLIALIMRYRKLDVISVVGLGALVGLLGGAVEYLVP
ncbi:MAG: chromate transporter [Fastidiosipila sp.]|nr:chromate transporter [Fastidiosipila sp.]